MSTRLVHSKDGRARKLYSCLICGTTWPCLSAALEAIEKGQEKRDSGSSRNSH